MEQQQQKSRGMAVREQIVAAACICLARAGYAAASISELAAAAQVSKNQLFYHFGSKEAVALAAVEQLRKAWRDELVSPAALFPEPRARLVFIAQRLKELQASGWIYDRLLAALALEAASLPPKLREAVTLAADELRRLFSGSFKELRAAQALSGGLKPRQLGAVAAGLVLSCAALRDLGEPFGDSAASLAALELLCGGALALEHG